MADEDMNLEEALEEAELEQLATFVDAFGIKALPIEMRQAIYFGIFNGLVLAVDNGEPSPLSDAELQLLGYGMWSDREAMETPISDAGMSFQLDEVVNRQNVMTMMYSLNDPRLERGVFADDEDRPYPDTWQVPVMDSWDSAEEDQVFNTALLLAAGTVPTSAAKPLAVLMAKVAGKTLGWAPSAAMKGLKAIGAATSMDVHPVLYMIRYVAPRTAALTGGIMAPVAIWDATFNYEENQEALGNVDAVAAEQQAIITSEQYDEMVQDQTMALRTAGVADPEFPPYMQITKKAGEQAPTTTAVPAPLIGMTAEVYAQGNPVPDVNAQQLAYEDDPRIGVSQTYDPTIGRGDVLTEEAYRHMRSPGVQRPDQFNRYVRYHESDFEDQLAAMTEGQVIWFQNMAQRALLVNTGGGDFGATVSPGVLDKGTRDALYTVMDQANWEGTDWKSALHGMAAAGWKFQQEYDKAHGPAPRTWTRPAYLAPDWDTLTEQAINEIETRLGRKPNEWEVQLLADHLGGLKKQAWDAEVEAARLTWEADGRALDTGEDQVAGTVQAVDPDASFDAFFREKFGKELDRVDRVGLVTAKTANLMQGFDKAASIVGGR